MNARQHSKCCPACDHWFIPWRVWQISRWTHLRCPNCRVRLTRRFDKQFFWLCVLICLVLAAIPLIEAVAWQMAVGAVGVLLFTLLDAVTVRLVEAERQGTHDAA